MTVAITDPATTGVSHTETASFASGDRLNLQCVPTDSPDTATTARWSFIYEEAADELSCLNIAGQNNALANLQTEYNNFQSGENWGATGFNRKGHATSDGTIQNLRVFLNGTASNFSGSGYTFTIMKNGSATGLACSILFGNTTCSDTGSISVAAGDELGIRSAPNGVALTRYAHWSSEFLADDDTEGLITSATANDMNVSAIEYNYIGGDAANWVTNINTPRKTCFNCYMSDLHVEVDREPGTGGDWVFTVMVNGIASALTVTISDSEVAKTDSTNVLELQEFDEVVLRADPTTAGPVNGTDSRWGVTVRSINPYPGSLGMMGMGQ